MKPTLLVLAAGMGSRYGGLKQIDPVGPRGEIIIDYSVFDAIRAGFGKIVFVIRPDIEAEFKTVVGSRFEGFIEVAYAFQRIDDLPVGLGVPEGRKKPWGTGHAILSAKNIINEPFAVINADDFYGRSGFELLGKRLAAAEDGDKADYSMVGFTLRNTLSENGTVSRGVCEIDGEHKLIEVVERTDIAKNGDAACFIDDNGVRTDLTADEIVSMNMWGFTPSIFENLERMFEEFLNERGGELKSEFFIPTVVDTLIKNGTAMVEVLESGDSWFGITYPEDKPLVVKSVARLTAAGVYPEKLF